MQEIIFIIHILAAICLVCLVLIQHGKGADVGAAFGSGASIPCLEALVQYHF